eukprot:gene5453-8905_t
MSNLVGDVNSGNKEGTNQLKDIEEGQVENEAMSTVDNSQQIDIEQQINELEDMVSACQHGTMREMSIAASAMKQTLLRAKQQLHTAHRETAHLKKRAEHAEQLNRALEGHIRNLQMENTNLKVMLEEVTEHGFDSLHMPMATNGNFNGKPNLQPKTEQEQCDQDIGRNDLTAFPRNKALELLLGDSRKSKSTDTSKESALAELSEQIANIAGNIRDSPTSSAEEFDRLEKEVEKLRRIVSTNEIEQPADPATTTNSIGYDANALLLRVLNQRDEALALLQKASLQLNERHYKPFMGSTTSLSAATDSDYLTKEIPLNAVTEDFQSQLYKRDEHIHKLNEDLQTMKRALIKSQRQCQQLRQQNDRDEIGCKKLLGRGSSRVEPQESENYTKFSIPNGGHSMFGNHLYTSVRDSRGALPFIPSIVSDKGQGEAAAVLKSKQVQIDELRDVIWQLRSAINEVLRSGILHESLEGLLLDSLIYAQSPTVEDIPKGWECCRTDAGLEFFINRAERITTWIHPNIENTIEDTDIYTPFKAIGNDNSIPDRKGLHSLPDRNSSFLRQQQGRKPDNQKSQSLQPSSHRQSVRFEEDRKFSFSRLFSNNKRNNSDRYLKPRRNIGSQHLTAPLYQRAYA